MRRLGAFAAALVLGGLLVVAAPARDAAFGNGRIAFVSDRDGASELYVLDGAGSDQTRMTNNGAVEDAPQWSSERLLAYTRALPNGAVEIFARNAFGADERLTFRNAHEDDPTWSPAGGKLAFASDREGNREIFSVTLTQFGATNLSRTPNANDVEPAWSPIAPVIAFVSDRDGNRELYVMNADGSQQRRLTMTAEQESDPSWSPNGRAIVYARTGPGGADIFVLEVASGAVRQLTNRAGDDVEPAWSPDGRKIAFASTRDGDLEIYVMNADGSAQANASNSHRASDGSPAWELVQAQYASVIRRRTRVFNPQQRPCSKSGNDRANNVVGTRGPDILCGKGGADVINGLAGADTLRGDDGNDVIRARDGEPDKIFGGDGRDVAFADPIDDLDGVEVLR